MSPEIKEEDDTISPAKSPRSTFPLLSPVIETERLLRDGSFESYPNRLTGRTRGVMRLVVDPSNSFWVQITSFT